MLDKEEAKVKFDWWVTCLPDNVERISEYFPEDVASKMDNSLESFLVLGEYLVGKETVNSIREKTGLWDCCAAYVGVTYEANVRNAKWKVELDKKNDIYWGIPTLRTPALTIFAPHFEITAMLHRSRPDFLHWLTQKHMKDADHFRA